MASRIKITSMITTIQIAFILNNVCCLIFYLINLQKTTHSLTSGAIIDSPLQIFYSIVNLACLIGTLSIVLLRVKVGIVFTNWFLKNAVTTMTILPLIYLIFYWKKISTSHMEFMIYLITMFLFGSISLLIDLKYRRSNHQ